MENMRPETVAIANLGTMTLEEIYSVMYGHAVAQLKAEREIPKSVEEYEMIVEGEDEFIKRMRKQSSILEIMYLRAKNVAAHERNREELLTVEKERKEQEAAREVAQQEEMHRLSSNEAVLSELERRLIEILRRA